MRPYKDNPIRLKSGLYFLFAGTAFLGCTAGVLAAQTKIPAEASVKKASKEKHHQFKNLPDIEVTEIREMSWQEEVNIYSFAGFSNTTVDFGLPRHWNIGLSVINVNLADNGSQPFSPDGFLNIEKAVKVWDNWHAVIGSQLGIRLVHDHQGRRLQTFNYIDNLIDMGEGGIHVGGYHVNRAMSGVSDAFGFLAGVDFPLPIQNLHFLGDYISGQNFLSAATAQISWRFAPRLEFGCGVVIPLPGSANDYSGLLEVNWR